MWYYWWWWGIHLSLLCFIFTYGTPTPLWNCPNFRSQPGKIHQSPRRANVPEAVCSTVKWKKKRSKNAGKPWQNPCEIHVKSVLTSKSKAIQCDSPQATSLTRTWMRWLSRLSGFFWLPTCLWVEKLYIYCQRCTCGWWVLCLSSFFNSDLSQSILIAETETIIISSSLVLVLLPFSTQINFPKMLGLF